MREAGSESVLRSLFSSRMLFLLALSLLAGYAALMASMGVTSPFVIVTGSSMEPTYHQGDLLLVKSATPASVSIDDVIVFHTPRLGVSSGLPSLIAHRVVGIQPVDGLLGYKTQGDNSDRDSFVVPSNRLIGRVHTNLGILGKPVMIFGKMKTLLVIGLPLALAAGVYWLMTRKNEDEVLDEDGGMAQQLGRQTEVNRQLAAQDLIRKIATLPRSNIRTKHANRNSGAAIDGLKNTLLDNRLSEDARVAFDDVLGLLDGVRTGRNATRAPE